MAKTCEDLVDDLQAQLAAANARIQELEEKLYKLLPPVVTHP